MQVKQGKYRHYKNKDYEVLFECKHSETMEDLVVYKSLYKNKLSKYWARPKKMFFEGVKINNKKIPRFKYIGDK